MAARELRKQVALDYCYARHKQFGAHFYTRLRLVGVGVRPLCDDEVQLQAMDCKRICFDCRRSARKLRQKIPSLESPKSALRRRAYRKDRESNVIQPANSHSVEHNLRR